MATPDNCPCCGNSAWGGVDQATGLCYRCAGFRRLTDRQVGYLAAVRRQMDADPDLRYPHCDEYILHAPEDCEFCRKSEALNRLRIAHHIAWTNDTHAELYFDAGDVEYLDPCPSEAFRPAAVRDRWYGNRAYPEGVA